MIDGIAKVAICLLLGSPTIGAHQQSTVIADPPQCSSCTVDMSKIVTLGGSSDSEGLLCPGSSRLAEDSRGRYFVGPSCDGQVLVFGPEGALIQRLGRRGQGPGEFESIGYLSVDHHDRLYVFDRRLLRMSVFTPNLEFIRSVRVPGTPTAVLHRANDTLLLQLPTSTREYAGLPILHIDREGNVLQAFGATDPSYRYDRAPFAYQRAIAEAGANRIWSGLATAYKVELWDVETGALLRTVIREASWFQEWTSYTPTAPTLWQVRVDDDRRLWVLSWVPDFDGLEKLEADADVPSPWHLERDSILDIIDLDAEKVLFTARHDLVISYLLKGNRAVTIREGETGDTMLDVWQLIPRTDGGAQ